MTALAARQQRISTLSDQKATGVLSGDQVTHSENVSRGNSSRARQSRESEDGSSFWAFSSDEERENSAD
jgi:hypothetical protein